MNRVGDFMVRQLENKWVGSNFGEWYRVNMPKNRTFTDIDDFENTFFGYEIIEARSPGYNPNPDNAQITLRAFARFLGVHFAIVKKIENRKDDLQHCVFVADQDGRFQLFVVFGNRSDLRGPDRYYSYNEPKWKLLSELATKKGLHPRVVRVKRDGCPEKPDDIAWMRACLS